MNYLDNLYMRAKTGWICVGRWPETREGVDLCCVRDERKIVDKELKRPLVGGEGRGIENAA